MEFYQTLAPWYDRVFPLDPDVVDWVGAQVSGTQGSAVLDVGCGTGTLLEALAARGGMVQGLEPDSELLALAQARLGQDRVRMGTMQELTRLYPQGTFNLVTCLGNTLAHLSSHEELANVCTQVRHLLAPRGSFLFQIINFDWVLDVGIKSLPTLDTPELRFERSYSLPASDGHITFSTRLEIKQTGTASRTTTGMEQAIPLFPMRRAGIETALRAAGFATIDWFADFQDHPWRPNGFLTVCKAII